MVAVMFVGVVALATTSSAASCTVTSTLRQGSKGEQVKCLQAAVGVVADGSFGAKTKAAVKVWQAAAGLVADGVFGAKSRAVFVGGSVSGSCPAGQMNPATGLPCSGGSVGTLPAGCDAAQPVQMFSRTLAGTACVYGAGSGNQTGPVSVALASDNPASGTIIAGQATADLLHVTFTGTGTVNSVTLTRSGVSDQNTLSNVYLYDGVQRLTDGYSFNTNSLITINNLNLAVNGSRTISVKADVASGTSSYDILVALTGVTSGTVANVVNIRGNDMFVASGTGTLASIAKDSTGTATGATGGNTVANGSVNAGATSYTVWRQAVQVSTRALLLKAANFRVTGSAPADALANVGFYVDGVKAGPNAALTMVNGSNYLSFDMASAPVSLTTGTHTLEVRGDISKGSSFSFSVSLQQASDIMVTDPQIGVNLAMCPTLACAGGSFTASTAGTISIGTGSYTNVIDPTFNAFTNVTAGASNVTIAKFKLHGYGEDVKVTSLPVTVALSAAATPAGVQNVTLYFNGSQVGSQVTLSSASGVPGTLSSDNCATTLGTSAYTCYTTTFTLGSQMLVPAGVDSTVEIKADLRNAAGTNYSAGSISANLQASTAEGWNSHSAVTGSAVTGNTLSLQSATLAVSKNAGYSNQNQNPNTAGVKIGSYVLQNQSTSESVRVTTLLVNLAYGSATSSSNLSGLKTSETSGNAGTPVQPATAAASANANNTFSADFILAPGAVKTLDILADSGSSNDSTNASVISTLTVTSIGMTSNVSTTSAGIPGQTIKFAAGAVTNPPTLVSSSSTTAQLVPAANGGASNATKATYNFASTGGASTITELKFTVTGDTTGTSVTVNGVSAPFVTGVAYLTGLSIPVPFGGSGLNLDVFMSYPEVGVSGVASTTTSAVALTYVKYTSGGASATFSPSVSAPTMVLVGSKPSFTVVDSSDTLSNSQVKIAEVTVTADAKGDIKIGKLPISVTSTGVVTVVTGANNIVVKDTNDTVVTTTNTGLAVGAGGTGTDTIVFGTTAANSYLISAGTSKTFRIYATPATVAGAVNTTSLSTKLGVNTAVEWYDVAGNNTVLINAANVFNYPSTTSVITN